MKEMGVLSVEVTIKKQRERERAIVNWPNVRRHLACTNSKCSLAELGISTFYEIIVNTNCEFLKLVLIWPTGKLRVILDKTIRLVLGTSFLGYESSWVRVVLGTSCLGCELSIIPAYAPELVYLCDATWILTRQWRYRVVSGGCPKHGDVLPTNGSADDALKSVYGIVLVRNWWLYLF